MAAVQPGAEDPAALKAIARHADAIATVRAFAERSEALRVVLLVDLGDEESPAMLDAAPGGAVELTDEGEAHAVPAGDARARAAARRCPTSAPPRPRRCGPIPVTGELAAPIGAIANLGHAVLGLARAFGGRSVATAEFATHDPDLPMTIVAREGEPLLLAVGDGRFELPLVDARPLHLVRRRRRAVGRLPRLRAGRRPARRVLPARARRPVGDPRRPLGAAGRRGGRPRGRAEPSAPGATPRSGRTTSRSCARAASTGSRTDSAASRTCSSGRRRAAASGASERCPFGHG